MDSLYDFVLGVTSATRVVRSEKIQELWSGYGVIQRLTLMGGFTDSVICKHICPPNLKMAGHSRGTPLSHKRKLRSYQVESQWYKKYAHACKDFCRVAQPYGFSNKDNQWIFVLEDLDLAGFSSRPGRLDDRRILAVISWLAAFHAVFLNEIPMDIWRVGCYWHLKTRPEEWKRMDERAAGGLKKMADRIDAKLDGASYKTFVHGDAKVENFCFSKDGNEVAAVDFQYVGGGVGVKDLAYFLGSCLSESEHERRYEELVSYYFKSLEKQLKIQKKSVDFAKLKEEWLMLYPYAIADFFRFYVGWAPNYWQTDYFHNKMSEKVVQMINGDT